MASNRLKTNEAIDAAPNNKNDRSSYNARQPGSSDSATYSNDAPPPRTCTHAGPLGLAVPIDAARASSEPTLADGPPQRLDLRLVPYGKTTPLAGTDAAGRKATLRDIFAEVNLDVVVEVQPTKPYTIGDRFLTPAELHSLVAGPSDTAPDWQVTAFLLRRGLQRGDRGGLLGDTRNRFAVFAAESGDDASAILRTVAHELGHSINLFHNDGDATFACCSFAGQPKDGTSLMNPDACLNQKSWRYGFSQAELEHLRRHPLSKLNPKGPAEFGACVPGHAKRC